MLKDEFSKWENQFRSDATKDGMLSLSKHLQRIGLTDHPQKLLHGTVMYLVGCCAYLGLDDREIGKFLAMQKYRPAVDADSHYAFTFCLHGRAFGRIITPLTGMCVDLADLYGHPWHEFQMCGYGEIRISRIDDGHLSKPEIEEIEQFIENDIYFDYGEDEVRFWTDPDSVPGVLIVCVYDVMPEDL